MGEVWKGPAPELQPQLLRDVLMTAFQDESINLIDKYHPKSCEPNFHLPSLGAPQPHLGPRADSLVSW